MDQVSNHNCTSTCHEVYAKSKSAESDMEQNYCDQECETTGEWLIIWKCLISPGIRLTHCVSYSLVVYLNVNHLVTIPHGCNYNFLLHCNTIDMHTTITIYSMTRLTYNANFIKLTAGDTMTTNSITNIGKTIYIHFNITIFPQPTGYISNVTTIIVINILFCSIVSEDEKWSRFQTHVSELSHDKSTKNTKIGKQKSTNSTCINQWTNESIIHKTHKDNITSLKRALKEMKIHVNIVYAAIGLRHTRLPKTMTVLSSLGRSFV